MALCINNSTKMSVVLSIKWSINRSWKEQNAVLHLKIGFKCFLPIIIVGLWIYCKKKKTLKPDFDVRMYVCIHTLVTFSDYFWSAVQRKGLWIVITQLSSLPLPGKASQLAFPCPASGSAAVSAQSWLFLLVPTRRFYFQISKAKIWSCLMNRLWDFVSPPLVIRVPTTSEFLFHVCIACARIYLIYRFLIEPKIFFYLIVFYGNFISSSTSLCHE